MALSLKKKKLHDHPITHVLLSEVDKWTFLISNQAWYKVLSGGVFSDEGSVPLICMITIKPSPSHIYNMVLT